MRYFHYAIAAWGREYIDMLLNVTLPTLSTEGNLPAFQKKHPIVVLIYNTAEDADRIVNSDIYKRFRRQVPLEVVTEDTEDHRLTGYSGYARLHRMATTDAARDKALGLILQNADVCWADGSFGYVAELVQQDVGCIHTPCYFRVNRQTFIPEILARGYEPDGSLPIPCRELIRVGMRHMHPYTASTFIRQNCFTDFPGVIGDVSGENTFVLNNIGTIPLVLFDPDLTFEFEGTMDIDVLSNLKQKGQRLYYLDDPSRFALVDMTDYFQYVNCIRPGSTADAAEMGEWIRLAGPQVSFEGEFFRRPFHLSCADRADSGDLIQTAHTTETEPMASPDPAATSRLVDDALAVKRLIGLGKAFSAHQAPIAASLWAAGTFATDLVQWIPWGEPLTFMGPSNGTFSRFPEKWLDDVMSPGAEIELRRFLLRHTLRGVRTESEIRNGNQPLRNLLDEDLRDHDSGRFPMIGEAGFARSDVRMGADLMHVIDGFACL